MVDIRKPIVDRLVSEVPLTKQSCNGFDTFVYKNIPNILSELHPILCEHDTRSLSISFLKPTLKSPCTVEKNGDSRPVYPNECRLRGLTYGSPLYVDLRVTRTHMEKAEESILKDVYLGRVPVMVFSDLCYLKDPSTRVERGECTMDPGGYFIING